VICISDDRSTIEHYRSPTGRSRRHRHHGLVADIFTREVWSEGERISQVRTGFMLGTDVIEIIDLSVLERATADALGGRSG